MFYFRSTVDKMLKDLEDRLVEAHAIVCHDLSAEETRGRERFEDLLERQTDLCRSVTLVETHSKEDLQKSHDELEQMHKEVDNAVQTTFEHIDKLSKHQMKIDNSLKDLLIHQTRKESDEPWIEVLGGDIDDKKGLQLNLDWNDAFIEQLRTQGYTGSSDSSLIGKYLLTLSQMVGDEQENV